MQIKKFLILAPCSQRSL